jgi:OmpA-OmpF porin, OOP family
MKKTLMCATAAAAFASAGFAAHAEDGWYARTDLQYGFSGKLDHDAASNTLGKMSGDSAADENLGGDFGLGYGFDNGFRIEGVGGYRGGELDVSTAASGIIPGTSVVPSGNIQIADLMINGIYDFNRAGNFQPYIGVGVGGVRVKAKASNRVVGVSPNISAANGFSDTDTGVGYQGLLGFGYKLTERLTLDLGYKYAVVEDMDFNGLHNGIDYTADYSDHSALLGLRYAFGAPPAPAAEPVAEVVPPPVVEPPVVEPPKVVEPPPAPPTRVTEAPVVQCGSLNQNFVVYFEWDKADLTSQASAVVDQAIANIRGTTGCNPSAVSIVGHTDSSGGNAYNDRLSARRADVVAGALTSRGIDAAIINKASKGETALAKTTRDGVREPLNRRSEVTISVR